MSAIENIQNTTARRGTIKPMNEDLQDAETLAADLRDYAPDAEDSGR